MASRGRSRTRRHSHRRSRRRCGGNAVLTKAAVPFGLLALSNYLGSVKKHRATHKGMHGKRSRRASMRKKK